MKMTELMQEKKTLAFEFNPPETSDQLEAHLALLDQLASYQPDFISTSYGAAGTSVGQNMKILNAISHSTKTQAMTHYTAIGKDQATVKKDIQTYIDLGIKTLLVIRGDYPKGWNETKGDFQHANELVQFIRTHYPQLELAVGAYPEKHKEAMSLQEDIYYLKKKQEAGADLIITQICYDIDQFILWIKQVRRAGVKIPISVGIMPVLSKDFIIRNTLNNACSIPKELAEIIARYGDEAENFKKAGKEYTAQLIKAYQRLDIAGFQIFTLNQAKDIGNILYLADLVK